MEGKGGGQLQLQFGSCSVVACLSVRAAGVERLCCTRGRSSERVLLRAAERVTTLQCSATDLGAKAWLLRELPFSVHRDAGTRVGPTIAKNLLRQRQLVG